MYILSICILDQRSGQLNSLRSIVKKTPPAVVHFPCPTLFTAATDTVYGTPGSEVDVGLENLLVLLK